MTKSQIQLAWEKIICETRKRPPLGKRLREKNISQLGDLLLLAQALLGKIDTGENNAFNSMIYKKTINFYCAGMKKYV